MLRIGKKLRDLRKDKGLTLKELSKKSGVALATLSRMETNKMPGTIESHEKICKVLGVSLAELYREIENKNKTVDNFSKKISVEVNKTTSKIITQLLVAKAVEKKMIPMLITFQPRSKSKEQKDKIGTEMFLYILNGHLKITIDSSGYDLSLGDSLYFDSSLPYSLANETNEEVQVLTVITCTS